MMVRLPPMLGVRDLLRLYQVRAKKQLSQNFLIDPAILGRFVSKAKVAGCHVVEVGAGPGTLTRSLLKGGPRSLTVVEKDDRFMPMLEDLAHAFPSSERILSIVNGDILRFDWELARIPDDAFRGWKEEIPPVRLVGNLPFSVATKLVIDWMFDVAHRRGPWRFGRVPMVLAFQDEVARRIVARPGETEWCRLSIMCQSLCNVEYGMKISGGSFVPPPKVNAGVVVLTPRSTPLVPLEQVSLKFFERVVRDIFNRKNQSAHKGVGNLVPKLLRKMVVGAVLRRAGIVEEGEEVSLSPPPVSLTVEQFVSIALVVKEVYDGVPELNDYSYKATRMTGEHLVERMETFLRAMDERSFPRAPVTAVGA